MPSWQKKSDGRFLGDCSIDSLTVLTASRFAVRCRQWIETFSQS